MKVHKLSIYLLIAASFLMIFACGGGGGGGDSIGYGELAIAVTDAKPSLPGDPTNFYVTITEVWAHGKGGWVELEMSQSPYTIDLLQFSNGETTELVPPVLLRSGKYTQIRLVLEEGGAKIKFKDDTTKYTVVIPSENLKTDKNIDFDVESDKALDLLIDFDLSQSLVVTDDGSGTLSYKLKPVLHIVDFFKAATISGEIVEGSDATVTVSVFNPDPAVQDYEEYTKVDVVWESGTGATEFVIFWLVPNEGLIPPRDYKVEIDVDKDDTVNYSKDGIFLEEGDDYFLGTIPPPTP